MRTIVISVGTSLLQNFYRKNAGDEFTFTGGKLEALSNSIRPFLLKPPDLDPSSAPERILEQFPCTQYITHFQSKTNLTNNIKKRGANNSGYDLLPAEISSLFFYYYNISPDCGYHLRDRHRDKLDNGDSKDCINASFPEKDKIILLCTDSITSVFCAKMISRIILCNPLFKDKCVMVNDLESFNGNESYCIVSGNIILINELDAQQKSGQWLAIEAQEVQPNCGYANLKKALEDIKEKYGESILIRSGGYKELSSILLILGIEYQIDSFYLFEESTEFIETRIKEPIEDLSNIVFGGIYEPVRLSPH